MVSKEYWGGLSDEEKSKVISEFCKINGLGPNFDYKEARKQYNDVQEKATFVPFKNPVLILELVDPIMADMILSWLYTEVTLSPGKRVSVPFMGYNLVEVVFDKTSMTNFSDSEKQILSKAMNILKSKGYGKED